MARRALGEKPVQSQLTWRSMWVREELSCFPDLFALMVSVNELFDVLVLFFV